MDTRKMDKIKSFNSDLLKKKDAVPGDSRLSMLARTRGRGRPSAARNSASSASAAPERVPGTTSGEGRFLERISPCTPVFYAILVAVHLYFSRFSHFAHLYFSRCAMRERARA